MWGPIAAVEIACAESGYEAGAARKIASDRLNDRADPQLAALLPPYVDSRSIWGDDRSWSLLRP